MDTIAQNNIMNKIKELKSVIDIVVHKLKEKLEEKESEEISLAILVLSNYTEESLKSIVEELKQTRRRYESYKKVYEILKEAKCILFVIDAEMFIKIDEIFNEIESKIIEIERETLIDVISKACKVVAQQEYYYLLITEDAELVFVKFYTPRRIETAVRITKDNINDEVINYVINCFAI